MNTDFTDFFSRIDGICGMLIAPYLHHLRYVIVFGPCALQGKPRCHCEPQVPFLRRGNPIFFVFRVSATSRTVEIATLAKNARSQ